jgi:hypothetical protein
VKKSNFSYCDQDFNFYSNNLYSVHEAMSSQKPHSSSSLSNSKSKALEVDVRAKLFRIAGIPQVNTTSSNVADSATQQIRAADVRTSPIATRSRTSNNARADKDTSSSTSSAPSVSNLPSAASSPSSVPSTQVEAARAALLEISKSHRHPQDIAIDFSKLKIYDERATDLFVHHMQTAFHLTGTVQGSGQGYNPPLLIHGHIQKTLEDKYARLSKEIKKEVFINIEQLVRLQSQRAKIMDLQKPGQPEKRTRNQLTSTILAQEAIVEAQKELDRVTLELAASKTAALVSIKDSEIKVYELRLAELLDSLPSLAKAIVDTLHLPQHIAAVHTADILAMLVKDFQHEKRKQLDRHELKAAKARERVENSQKAAATVLESSEHTIQTVIQKSMHTELTGFFRKAHNVLSKTTLRPEEQNAVLQKIAAEPDSKIVKGSVERVSSLKGRRPTTPDTNTDDDTTHFNVRKLRSTSKSPRSSKNGSRRSWRHNREYSASSAKSTQLQKSSLKRLPKRTSRESRGKKVVFHKDFTGKERREPRPPRSTAAAPRSKSRSRSNSMSSSSKDDSSRRSSSESSKKSDSSSNSKKQQQQPRAAAANGKGRGRGRGRRRR